MAQINLETAWQNKKQSATSVSTAQDQVNTLTRELGDASNGLTRAQQSDQQAETVLESVAAQTPPGKVAETTDGTILFVIGGHIYEYGKVAAGDVTGDDGGGSVTPPVPVVGPTPEPTPAVVPDPNAPATPDSGPTPPPASPEVIPGFTP
jgi:hypothetical protein